jgi:hypothetical protein
VAKDTSPHCPSHINYDEPGNLFQKKGPVLPVQEEIAFQERERAERELHQYVTSEEYRKFMARETAKLLKDIGAL